MKGKNILKKWVNWQWAINVIGMLFTTRQWHFLPGPITFFSDINCH